MAFGFRNSAERALTVLGSSSIDNILSTASKDFERHESEKVKFFNFALSDVKKAFASSNGIYISPAAYLEHSHPLSKVIENHFLFDILPSLLCNVNNFYVMSMKSSKLSLLLNNSKFGIPSKIVLINRLIDIKDSIRYSNLDVVSEHFMFSSCVLDRSLVPSSDSILKLSLREDSFFFLHDELHYWKKQDLFMFLRKFSPSVLCATVVYPVELLEGVKSSLIPFAYSFELIGSNLVFSPDGCTSESYSQPADLRWLFEASCFVVDDQFYSVDIIKTVGAHHFFMIVKGRRENRTHRVFGGFDSLDLFGLKGVRFKCPIPNVRFSLFQKLVVYLMSLKKPDVQSAVAKFRQLAGDDLSLPEMMFFEDFAARLVAKGKGKISLSSLLDKLKASLRSVCPDFMLRVFSNYQAEMMMRSIMESGPFKVKVTLKEIKEHTPFECFSAKFLRRDLITGNRNEFPLACDRLLFGNKSSLVEFGFEECHDRGFLSRYLGSYLICKAKIKSFNVSGGVVDSYIIEPGNRLHWIRYNDWRLLTQTLVGLKSSLSEEEIRLKDKFFKKEHLRLKELIKIRTNFIRFRDASVPFSFRDFIYFSESFTCHRYQLALDYPLTFGRAPDQGSKKEVDHLDYLIEKFDDDTVNLGALDNAGETSNSSDLSLCNWIYFETLRVRGLSLQGNSTAKKVFTPLVEEVETVNEPLKCPVEGNPKDGADAHEVVADQESEHVNPNQPMEEEGSSDCGVDEVDSCGFSSNEGGSEFDESAATGSDFSHLHDENAQFADGQKTDTVFDDVFESFDVSGGASIKSDTPPPNCRGKEKATGGAKVSFNFSSDSSVEGQNKERIIRLRKVPELNINRIEVVNGNEFLGGLLKVYNDLNVNQDVFRVVRSLLLKLKPLEMRGRECYFFCRHQSFEYGHDKVKYKNSGWPAVIEELNRNVERVTGEEFNSVLINSYSAGGKIPYHADNEDVYDMDDCPVFTFNLVGNALLSFKGASTMTFDADKGTGILMTKTAQKFLKHRVKSTTERISLTFRNQKRAARWQNSIELSDMMIKINDVLERDLLSLNNKCLLDSFSAATNLRHIDIFRRVCVKDISIFDMVMSDKGASLKDIEKFSVLLSLNVKVLINGTWSYFGVRDSSFKTVELEISGNHVSIFDDRKIGSNVAREIIDDQKKRLTGSKMFFYKLCDMIDPLGSSLNRVSRPINFDRAAKLLSSLKSGNTGVISSDNFGFGDQILQGYNAVVDKDKISKPDYLRELAGTKPSQVEGVGIFGFAGCGKSKPVQDSLNEIDSPLRSLLISPRRRLLDDWKKKVTSKNVTFKTFETSLMENLSNYAVIVLDEIGLFPRGFIDLLMLRVNFDVNKFRKQGSEKARLVILGDPLQAFYFNSSDESRIDDMNEFRALQLDEMRYMMYSYRLPKCMNKVFDVECLGADDGNIDFVVHKNLKSLLHTDKSVECVLVPSHLEKGLFQEFDNVMTMGESQGLTFKHVAVVLTENSLVSSDNQTLVALTRSKVKLSFVSVLNYDIAEFKKKADGKLIGKVMQQKKVSKDYLKAMIGTEEIIFLNSGKGIGRLEDEIKLDGDPWMKGMIDLSADPEPVFCEPQDVPEVEPKIKVHLPITDFSYVMSFVEQNMRAKEYREAKRKGDWSSQFKDDNANLRHKLSTGPVNFESIFPRHSADDSVTFWMAVAKRLRFSNPIREAQELDRSWTKGKMLFNEFIKKIKVRENFEGELYNKALIEFNKVRLSKTSKLIEVHSNRSDPDWDFNKFKLFMKSQLCKKAEKAFCDAKAGQTLACFSHAVLYRFSTWCRYAEMKVNKATPEHFYIHSKKNFDDLEKWVKRFAGSSMCVESDYEAFDSSQDATILAFEVNFLKHVGWPEDVISDYVQLKLDLGCKLGNLAIMRFTGEFGTFLFNTLANMAFTFCKYDINQLTPVAFAGDDMCILGDPRIRGDYKELLDSLRLKAKVQRMRYPMFCGWLLTPYGIIKLPSIIYERLLIAQEKGNLRDCIDSYTIEAGYAYRVGDRIYDVLDEHQMNFHQSTIRFLILHKHLMKGSSIDILEDISQNYTDEDISQDAKILGEEAKKFYHEIVSNKLNTCFQLA